MTKHFEDRYAFLEKVGVGYDSVIEIMDTLDALYYDAILAKDQKKYPPYNVKKTGPGRYLIELSVAGYDKEEVHASIDGEVLTVSVTGSALDPDPEGDDFTFHRGIDPVEGVYMKFLVAKNLELDECEYKSGILFFRFKDAVKKRDKYTIPIGPFPKKAKKAKAEAEVKYDHLGRPIESAPVVTEDKPVVAEPSEEAVSVVVHPEATDVPTVEVVLPEVLPQIVEVVVSEVPAEIDAESTEPQIVVEVKDATYEVSDDVEIEVIKTDEGQPDIVVAIDPEVAKELEEKGIDAVEEVVAAVEAALEEEKVEIVDLPANDKLEPVSAELVIEDEKVAEVILPETITQVVEVKVEETDEGPKVTLEDVSSDIPAEAELIPVITADNESDAVLVVTPETKEKLEELGVTDVAADIGAVLVESETAVEVVADTPAPFDASGIPGAAGTQSGPAPEREETSVVLHANDEATPTVEVVLEPELPQIVEVKVEELPAEVNAASEESQIVVTLEDSVHEIVPDGVATEVAKTPEGTADVVIAVTEETKEKLEELGIDVLSDVKEAIEIAVETEITSVTETPAVEVVADSVVEVTPEAAEEAVAVIEVPAELPHVVEVKVEEAEEGLPAIVFGDVKSDVPAEAELVPVVTANEEDDIIVAVTPETKEKLEELGVSIEADIAPVLVEEEVPVATETPAVAEEAVAEEAVAEEAVAEEAVAEEAIVHNADEVTTPTVEIVLPEELPQIVEVKVEELPAEVDAESSEPQVKLVVEDATYEVVTDTAETTLVKTEDGKADIVVAIDEELNQKLDELGIDALQEVKLAIDGSPLPGPEVVEVAETEVVATVVTDEDDAPKLEVHVPAEVTPVVEAVLVETENAETPVVELVPVAEVSEDHELIPVVTAEGENDIVVAVTPETKVELAVEGIDLQKDLSEALVQEEITVAKPDPSPGST